MDDRHRDQSREFDRRERARALIGADARAFTLSHPSAARVAGLLALEIPPTHERACAQAQTRERENTQTWRSPVSLASAMIFAILLALGLHSASRSGSLAAPAFVSPERFEARLEESAMRKNPKSFAVAAAAALSVSLTATAQDAVQWRVEDGGNGHWYVAVNAATGDSGLAIAASLNGNLATIASAGENALVKQVFLATDKQWAWLGLRQVSGQSSPALGWYWITGEPLNYLNWTSHDGAFPTGAPDDSPCALPPWGVENDQANQGAMDRTGRWDDLETGSPSCGGPTFNTVAIIEWSADCNSDGIVDFGQILAGELDDANGNNIPDCCEAGTSCACPADITGNGNVDAADLAAVLSAWGGAPSGKENADINGDGSIDAADLAGVLSAWGPCP
jgi:hypothetical protein